MHKKVIKKIKQHFFLQVKKTPILAAGFFKKNLAQIVLIFFLIQISVGMSRLPFLNIIPNFLYYELGVVIFIALVIFRVSIPNRRVIHITLYLFAASIVTEIFDIKKVSEIIGFIAFVLILFIVVREIIKNRKTLANELITK